MKLVDAFIEAIGHCETPKIYLRWSMLAAIGAVVGRNAYIQFGPDKIYPNLYVILVGASAARKSTGLKVVRALLKEAGFRGFSPNRCRKEALWQAMARLNEVVEPHLNGEDNFDLDAVMSNTEQSAANMFLLAPELTAFSGHGDDELFMSLTDLYDNLEEFTQERTTSKNVYIYQPTLSILAATTPTELNSAMPPSTIGGGFFSRTIFVHGKPACKVANPSVPDAAILANLSFILGELRALPKTQMVVTQEAKELNEELYRQEHFLTDRRLESYLGRRFTHLQKVAMLSALSELRTTVEAQDLIVANTYLSLAELKMPAALGHFGTSANSNISSLVLEAIKTAKKSHTIATLHKALGTDLTSQKQLQEIVLNLKSIGKINLVAIQGKRCLVAIDDGMDYVANSPYIKQELVTKEERV